MSEPYYGWAIDAVEGLRWLVHLDDFVFADARQQLRGRDARVIDVTHVRWATTTAITAVDLCGAEIAVRHCGEPFWSERMPPIATVGNRLRGQGSSAALDWIESLEADADYQLLRRGARDPLAHRFLVRTALIGPGRTLFELDRSVPAAERPDARQIISLALEVAERHVGAFRPLTL